MTTFSGFIICFLPIAWSVFTMIIVKNVRVILWQNLVVVYEWRVWSNYLISIILFLLSSLHRLSLHAGIARFLLIYMEVHMNFKKSK